MSVSSPFDQIAEHVERRLLRYDEVRRTNELLHAQLEAVTRDRDSLTSRLGAARRRIDALLDRLPAQPGLPAQPAPQQESGQ